MKKRIKSVRKKSGFFSKNYGESWNHLKSIKNYIWIVIGLFAVAIIVGHLFPGLFREQIEQFIRELIEKTKDMGPLELTLFIMYNNIKSAFFAVIFGVFFGIVPVIMTLMNGYVLGFVSNMTVANVGAAELWKLFPHGIFELPAIIISVAVGIHLGMFLFLYRGKNKWKEFKKWLVNSFRVFVFIVIPLLLIAGVIEGLLIGLLS